MMDTVLPAAGLTDSATVATMHILLVVLVAPHGTFA